MGGSLTSSPFLGPPKLVQHPYGKDAKRDSNLENCPFLFGGGGLHDEKKIERSLQGCWEGFYTGFTGMILGPEFGVYRVFRDDISG